ncbi:Tn3 family transposase [Mesorhizobium sp. M0809]|uniref:Tn3 family transposase n=1 Tax=Mesorhizobium sp. M0809 TaxID=2957003 RepID=UPI0033377C02
MRDLEQLLVRLKEGEFSIARLHSLGAQLLTYVRSNRGAIVYYGKRCRAGLRVATTLTESAVNSVLRKRMVKKQQMRWSLHGAHMLVQVRAAEINGELRNRLRAPFRQPELNGPLIAYALTVYLSRAVDYVRGQGIDIPAELLSEVAPLLLAHIALTGDYLWKEIDRPLERFTPIRANRFNPNNFEFP